MKITLKNDKPETLREFVETFQHTTVAPKILAEDGWDAFEVRLTDEEISALLRSARIEAHKPFPEKRLLDLCNAIYALLTIRFMANEGYLEETASETGETICRLTPKGEAMAVAAKADTSAA